jgi:hypothetical protein
MDDDDDAPLPARAFWRLDELIKEARERGLSDDATADTLEDAAGALRQGLSWHRLGWSTNV